MYKLLVCLAAALAAAPQPPRPESARAVVARSIEALGGEPALKRIATLQIDAIGHDFFIDQSERPEGPFIVTYVQTSEKRDVAAGRSRIESQQRFTQSPDWSAAGSATIADADTAAFARGDRYGPAGRQALEDARERVELAPERLLLGALNPPHLPLPPDATAPGHA